MACMEGYIITLITFLHFPFSNVSSRCLHNWTKNCINYNSFDFLRYGFSMVSPWHFYQSTKSHTNCICLINTRAPDGVLGVSEFCCKSEIKENWKVIWQKPRESRSLGSLGVLGVSESQTVNCTIAAVLYISLLSGLWNIDDQGRNLYCTQVNCTHWMKCAVHIAHCAQCTLCT